MKYLVSIGLETHVQLKTRTKMFCGCHLTTDDPPNTNVCPVCLGYPGALPRMNRKAIQYTVMSGLMLGCEINRHSEFDRKNYFYPDMPKNYQISQNAHPLCLGGGVDIPTSAGTKRIRINHIHLEEDAAKINHYARHSGVDFNRGGTPLMEIVGEPDLASADETMAYLTALKEMLVYAGVSDCNLEEGNMRSDVNISVRPEGQEKLGTKVEIKNMNTFKGIHAAIEYEVARQIEVLSSGGAVVQETRRWDADLGETQAMRNKENAHDYRYFPEPDLVPVELSDEQIVAVEKRVNELIRSNFELVEKRDATMDEAREMGAMALFGEKYGDRVRVVRFGPSVELCGGCHTSATGNIGFFKITGESAIAAGIRRIEAVTGAQAEELVCGMQSLIKTARGFFNNAPDLAGAIQKMIEDNATFKKQAEEFAKQKAADFARQLAAKAQQKGNVQLIVAAEAGQECDPALVRNAALTLQKELKNTVLVGAYASDGKPQLVLMYSDDLVAAGRNAGKDIRDAAKFIQGGGGGQPGLATAGGKNAEGLKQALDALVEIATR